MKTLKLFETARMGFTLVQMMIVMALLSLLAALNIPKAKADNFNVTNWIGANTSITSWPTNTPTTNAAGATMGYQTGGKVSVANQRSLCIEVSGVPTGSSTFDFTIVRTAVSTPIIYINTNNWTLENDWDTINSNSFLFSVSGTNAFSWTTNIEDNYTLGDAMNVGISQMTNGAAAISNLVIQVNKKILPIRYP